MSKSCPAAVVVLALIHLTAPAAPADPASYSGSLSAGSGLIATGTWDNPATSVSWTVDDTTTPGKWHYEYIVSVPHGGISHFIVELSDDDPGPEFTAGNIKGGPTSTPTAWLDAYEIDDHDDGVGGTGGNPFMPEDMYGIKFEAADDSDDLVVTIVFDSDRGPTWGDFYSKDGSAGGAGVNTIYNAGFTTADPTDPPDDGSILNHLLVPDTVPEPGAMVLIAGGSLVGVLRRRRRSRRG